MLEIIRIVPILLNKEKVHDLLNTELSCAYSPVVPKLGGALPHGGVEGMQGGCEAIYFEIIS